MYEEEDTCISYEEEDTYTLTCQGSAAMCMRRRIHACHVCISYICTCILDVYIYHICIHIMLENGQLDQGSAGMCVCERCTYYLSIFLCIVYAYIYHIYIHMCMYVHIYIYTHTHMYMYRYTYRRSIGPSGPRQCRQWRKKVYIHI